MPGGTRMSKRKSLPPLSAKVPAELRPLMAAIAEIIETGEGLRGDKLDRKLTLRDLLDGGVARLRVPGNPDAGVVPPSQDRKSTRLNSSHVKISYAVFCLK